MIKISRVVVSVFVLVMGTGICFGQNPSETAGLQKVLARLTPLPKEIAVQGEVKLPAKEIRLVVEPGSGEMVQAGGEQVKKLFREKAGNESGGGKFVIRLAVIDEKTGANGEWREQAGKLKSLPNSDQAYVIFPVENRELVVAGLSEHGVYFGTTTLCQMLEGATADGQVSVPLAQVRDWPDIEQRGFWDDNFSESQIEKLAGCKFNVVQVSTHLGFDKQGHGIVTGIASDDRRGTASGATFSTMSYRHGIKSIPYIPHISTLKRAGLYEHHPELMGKGESARTAKHKSWQAPCTSEPGFAKVLSEWMVGMASLPHVDEVSVWLTEEGVSCGCSKCREQGEFVAQTRAIVNAWRQAQQKYPNLKLQLLLTQGSYPTNDKVLAASPADLRIMYYDGGRSYDSSREPMIYPLLADYASKGGWLGVVPQTTASWAMVVPWSCPQFIRQQMNEFYSKKLHSVLEYAHPEIDLYDFNVTAVGEWSWNTGGRSEGEFAQVWAARKGLKDPQAAAKWAEVMGPASWNLYGSKFPYELYWFDAGTLVQSGMGPSWGKSIFHYFKNAADLDRNIASCGQAMEIAKTTGSDELVEETQVVQSYYMMLKAISQIMTCVFENPTLNEANKQIIRQNLANLKAGHEQLAAALPSWGRRYGIGSNEGRLGNTIRDMKKIADSITRAANQRMGENKP